MDHTRLAKVHEGGLHLSMNPVEPDELKPHPGRPPVLEVAVLGRVEVRVDEQPLRIGRAKSVELLVYLAMHQGGTDADQLWEALWPYRPMSRAVLHTTVSVARRALRDSAERTLLVSDARGGGLYHLAGPLWLDWHQFEQLADEGRGPGSAGPGGADRAARTEALAAALDLVRGPPFTTAAHRSYDWAWGYRTELEATIGSVAERLGHLRLEQGDVIGARQVARRGLRGAPYDERLYRLLMLAAHASNHPRGVEAVMGELTNALGIGPDETDRETRDLYQQLRRASAG